MKKLSLTLTVLALAGLVRADEKSAIAKIESLGGRVLYIAKDSKEYSVTIVKDTFDKKKGFTAEDAKLLGELKKLIETTYDWALALDCTKPSGDKYFWYRSAEKEEPRLGKRYLEPGAELEMPIGIARDVTCLYEKLRELDNEISAGEFLVSWPEFRRVVRRIQTLAELPYAEIRDNLIGLSLIHI